MRLAHRRARTGDRGAGIPFGIMLASLLFSASLEGLQPSVRVPRDPLPVVWYDRIREPRRVRNAFEIARALTADGGARRPRRALPADELETTTAADPVGWATAVLCESA